MPFVENLLLMLLYMGAGFAAGKGGILKTDDTKALSGIIYYLSAPALVLFNMVTSFHRNQILEGFALPVTGAVLTVLFIFLAHGGGKLFKVSGGQFNLFKIASAFSNTIFLGLPVIVSMYGPGATFYVVLYDLGATLVFWTLGVCLISGDNRLKPMETVKAVLNFPLLCFVGGLLLVLLAVPVPAFLLRAAEGLGNLTTPLAMIFVGLTLSGASLASYREDRTLKFITLIKLLVLPCGALALLYFLPLSPLAKKVMVLEAGMPVMITTAIMARKYDRDYEYSTRAVVVTTLLFFLTVPLFGLVLNSLWR